MGQLRERGEAYGSFEKVLDHVAAQDGLSHEETERVLNAYRRGRETPRPAPDLPPAKGIVQAYHQWLARTGRLDWAPRQMTPYDVLRAVAGEED